MPYDGPQMSLENAWLRLGKAIAEGVFKTQVVINGKVIQSHDILQIWHLIIYTGMSSDTFIIPPANFVCGGYTVFTLSVRACVRVVCASVRASVRPTVCNVLFP